jgi:hypothetical protein
MSLGRHTDVGVVGEGHGATGKPALELGFLEPGGTKAGLVKETADRSLTGCMSLYCGTL